MVIGPSRGVRVSLASLLIAAAIAFAGCGSDSPDDSGPTCGNGETDGLETCDGSDLGGETCQSLGLSGDGLACREDCADYDRSNCDAPETCGDQTVQEAEFCDGDDLAGETCQSQGYESGTLACADNCLGFDVSGCTSESDCDPDTCEDLGAECGTVDDGCGGTLECGGCGERLTCGGAGEANVCGAECATTCPENFSCNDVGVCTGETPEELVLNVETAEVTVGVTVDGAPFESSEDCGPRRKAGSIYFVDPISGDRLERTLPCDGSSSTWQLPHGNYRVAVTGNFSNIPYIWTVLRDKWRVDGDKNATFDISTATLETTVRIDGAPAEPTEECGSRDGMGEVYVTRVGTEHDTSSILPCGEATREFHLPHGEYRVEVFGEPESNIPEIGTVLRDGMTLDSDRSLTADVATASVEATATVEGAAPEPTDDCNRSIGAGEVTFTRKDSGDHRWLDLSCDGTSEKIRLPHGEYEVGVSGDRSNIPPIYTIRRDQLTLDGDRSLSFDIQRATVETSVLLDGETPQPDECTAGDGSANINFVRKKSGADLDKPLPCDGSSLEWNLAEGEYRVTMRGVESNIPDIRTVVRENLAIDGDRDMTFDLSTATVEVTAKMDGTSLDPDEECDRFDGLGEVLFTRADTGDSVFRELPCDGSAGEFRIPHGTYAIGLMGAGSNLPGVLSRRRDEVTIDSDETFEFDIPTTTFEVILQIDGAPVEPTDECSSRDGLGELAFVRSDTGSDLVRALPCDGSATEWHLPGGEYRIRVQGADSNLADFTDVLVDRIGIE